MNPLQLFRYYREGHELLKETHKVMLTVTSTTTKVTQIAAMLAQALNLFGGIIPAKYQPWVALILAASQAMGARVAHNSNPDGTPAR